MPQGTFLLTHTGNALRFQSSSRDWLIVDGSSGVVRGTRMLNGVSRYTFDVTFHDKGSGTQDRLCVRIWHMRTNPLVYDRQPGNPMTAWPSVRLISGNSSMLRSH